MRCLVLVVGGGWHEESLLLNLFLLQFDLSVGFSDDFLEVDVHLCDSLQAVDFMMLIVVSNLSDD